MYVILFAIVGWMRGWAKELLVSFQRDPGTGTQSSSCADTFRSSQDLPETDVSLFWIETIILLVLVYFGYQTVISIPHLAAQGRRASVCRIRSSARSWARSMVI